jgi:hypothetical protein
MKTKKNIQLNLSNSERSRLRRHKIKKTEIPEYAVDELEALLEVSLERAREIYALADFQRIPSIGIRFAEDLIFLGYYAIDELQNQDGAQLTDAYEVKKGYKTDVCVEDQFRLVVYFAKTQDYSKNWWDFTAERKIFRSQFGYPKDRPTLNWTEVIPPKNNRK